MLSKADDGASDSLLAPIQSSNDILLRDVLQSSQCNQWVLILSGGFHHPFSSSSFALNAWKVSLFLFSLLYFVYMLLEPITYIWALSDVLIGFTGILHFLILLPVFHHAKKRFVLKSKPMHQTVCADVLCYCRSYLILSMLLISAGCFLITVFYTKEEWGVPVSDVFGYIWYYVLIFLSVGSITLLSTWAMFFIIFDAKTVQTELAELIHLTNRNSLTCDKYMEVYNSLQQTLGASLVLCDAIAVVCYVNILACFAIIMFGEKTLNVYYTVGISLLFLREGTVLAFCLPSIVQANELHEKLGQALAAKAGDFGVWVLTKEWPLHILVLGRKMVPIELRYQVTSLLLMMLISITTFLIRIALY